jgi:annexin A7/11
MGPNPPPPPPKMFEAAFEVGVKTGKDEASIRAASRTQVAAASAQADYKGSGGPGIAADMDALYAQAGVDPSDWKGRGKTPSLYALELQSRQIGAYSAEAGWVSGYSARQRELKSQRVQDLLKTRSASITAREQNGDSNFATVRPYTNFDPDRDAKEVRKAMRFLGTNEKTIVDIFARRTYAQRCEIRNAYKTQFARDMEKDLRSDLGGNLRTAIVALIQIETERWAEFLNKSLKGVGTDNRLLVDILCTKEADEIHKVKEAYAVLYPGEDLFKNIINDTSGDFKRLILELYGCRRAPLSAPVVAADVEKDAQALYKAGEKKWGTDEAAFIEILTTRSFPQIRAIVDKYEDISKKGLLKALQSELSGNFLTATVAIVEYALDPTEYICRRLYESMAGWGTRDWCLILHITDHCELDMDIIKERFPGKSAELAKDGKPRYLKDMISGDTSGRFCLHTHTHTHTLALTHMLTHAQIQALTRSCSCHWLASDERCAADVAARATSFAKRPFLILLSVCFSARKTPLHLCKRISSNLCTFVAASMCAQGRGWACW